MKTELTEHIDRGFTSVYDEYETLSRENPIDIARRNLIRKHIAAWLKPHDRILEINAGSGIDAVYFANLGHDVLATDISEGAQHHIISKIRSGGYQNLHFRKCAYEDLDQIPEKFDHIFSNFGGLNCTDDLKIIFAQFDQLLNPGGFATLVIMPRYYPWEMVTSLKGNSNAFRRLKKNGVIANVGDGEIHTFYHSPTKIKNAFPKNFRHVKTRNIGTFYPSAHFQSFRKFGNIISWLLRFDERINNSSLMLKGVGDYFIITFQKTN
jgi:ubiquinone/menaquinone biosynthesis C-methylase UbiE